MNSKRQVTRLAILLYDGYTALDVIGPYDVLSKLPDMEVCMVAVKKGAYRDPKGLQLLAGYTLEEMEHPDILLIPGGFGLDSILNDQKIIQWVQNAYTTSKWTVAVCTGSLLLGAAGLLQGRKATTHWRHKERLTQYGAIPQNERYIKEGKIITSAGVSAGIDMSLYLLSLIKDEKYAKTVQLAIEYDPHPPFDSGSPEKAPREIVDRLRQGNNTKS